MSMIRAAIFLFALVARAEPADDPKWAGNLSMNGYELARYSDFPEKWKLVTARYRKDTGEFRFTYANELAWKALQAGATEYPDGAVFAKAAYILSDDANFPLSLVPSKVSRYQLMVHDKTRHAATGGWGYALFDPKGKTFPGEPAAVSRACAACHAIVSPLGGVFSQPMPTRVAFVGEELARQMKTQGTFLPSFDLAPIDSLPGELRRKIPKGVARVRSMRGALRKDLFQGTLDEIRPFLTKEAASSGLPAILLSEDGHRFAAVWPDRKKNAVCGAKNLAMESALTLPKQDPLFAAPAYLSGGKRERSPVATRSFCYSAD